MNLDDPSTRKRTLLGFPVSGLTKWRDLEDDLNGLEGILVARPKPHFEDQYKIYDFIIHIEEDFKEETTLKIKELCKPYQATFLITT